MAQVTDDGTELPEMNAAAANAVVDTEKLEMGTVSHGAMYGDDPLAWEIDGERGVWDMCIVFDNCKRPEKEKEIAHWNKIRVERGKLLERLHLAGVMHTVKHSKDHDTLFYLLSAKRNRYELQAEIMQMEFELHPSHGGSFLPFSRDPATYSMFKSIYQDDFFTSTQRQHMLKQIVTSDEFHGGAGIPIAFCLEKGIVQKWFPFHTHKTVRFFREEWATWRFWKWPLNSVRDYFGEELAIYFAWLQFYLVWLVGASVLGVVVFAVLLATVLSSANDVAGGGVTTTSSGGQTPANTMFGSGIGSNVGAWFSSIYAVLLMLWATLFLEMWKRRNNELAYRWNVTDFAFTEQSRPEYKGVVQLGVHHGDEWVPFEKDDDALKKARVVPAVYYPRSLTQRKVTCGFMPLIIILIVLMIAIISLLGVRFFLQRYQYPSLTDSTSATAGGIIGSIINAVVIIAFNVLYGKVARWLTNWENHRTDSQYQDALIFKTFLFQFVNTFASMYYIAFAKRGTDWLSVIGRGDVRTSVNVSERADFAFYQDKCKSSSIDETGQYLQYFNTQLGPWTYNGTEYAVAVTDPLTFLNDTAGFEPFAVSFIPRGQAYPNSLPGFVNVTFDSSSKVCLRYNPLTWFVEFVVNNGTFTCAQLSNSTAWTAYVSQPVFDNRVLGAGCMTELMTQLGILMAVNMFIGQFTEIGIPALTVLFKKFWNLFRQRKDEDEDEADLPPDSATGHKVPWEVQARLNDFGGTFDEYGEMVVQYSLVVTFAAAFPLAPLLAMINNFIELRTDAIKILNTANKPFYKSANTIGGWYRILDFVGYVAVVTNALIILLGFSVLPNVVHTLRGGVLEPFDPPRADEALYALIIAVIIEHLVLMLKYVISEMIPDMPGYIRRQLARREFLKEEILNSLDDQIHFRRPNQEDIEVAGEEFQYGLGGSAVRPLEVSDMLVDAIDYTDALGQKTRNTHYVQTLKEKRKKDKAAAKAAAGEGGASGVLSSITRHLHHHHQDDADCEPTPANGHHSHRHNEADSTMHDAGK